VYDFTDKPHVVHAEILTPADAPDWCRDRETLWNTVEACERRKDAQLARDLVFALPRELEPAECIALGRACKGQSQSRLIPMVSMAA
jgi:hypothetical protein